MIKTKADLKEYLAADKRQLGITHSIPYPFGDEIWKYEIILRKYEYWLNRESIAARFMRIYYKLRHRRNSIKYGIGIGPNCCDKGLSIAHIGTIQINGEAKVGKNLRIQEGVNVGAGRGGAPTIGDNVFLGSGCKVIGGIKIMNDCAVGANAVVVKDVLEEGITVAGVPAKKISNKNSYSSVFWFNGGKAY